MSAFENLIKAHIKTLTLSKFGPCYTISLTLCRHGQLMATVKINLLQSIKKDQMSVCYSRKHMLILKDEDD